MNISKLQNCHWSWWIFSIISCHWWLAVGLTTHDQGPCAHDVVTTCSARARAPAADIWQCTLVPVTRPVRPVLPSPPLELAPCSERSQRWWLGAGLGSILGTHRSSVEVLAGPGKFDRHPSNNTKWKNFGKNESIWFLVTCVRQCHTIPTNYLLCQYLWTSAKGCIRGEHKVKKEGFKRLGQSPGCKKIKHF